MINSAKNFFKLVFFELKKIWRSPIIFVFLLVGPLVMQFFVCVFTESQTNLKIFTDQQNIVFVKNGDISENVKNVLGIFSEDEKIEWKDDLEDELLKLKVFDNKLVLYVETQTSPQEITLYYNNENLISKIYAEKIKQIKDSYTYVTILNYLDDYFGISIDKNYFEISEIENVGGEVNVQSNSFSTTACIFLAFILMLGIVYSMARDNETGVFKQLCYFPLSTNKYLSVKMFLFAVIGIVEMLFMILISYIFGMTISGNFIIFILIVALYTLSQLSMFMLFSTVKNQISGVCLAIIAIIMPLIVCISISVSSLPAFLQALLYISPLTPFINSSITYINFGVVKTLWIIIMAVEFVVYYLLTLLIVKYKTGTLKKNKRI